jgi:hypothetical protein
MSARGGGRKKRARVDQVPDFDNIYNAVLDSHALVRVGYDIIVSGSDDRSEEYTQAIVAIHQGVILLKKAARRFEEANSRLSTFCLQNDIKQEHLQEDES